MSKLQEEVKRLMLQEEKELPEANPTWMQMKIELFSNEDVFAGLAKCAGYVKKEANPSFVPFSVPAKAKGENSRTYNSNNKDAQKKKVKKSGKRKW